MENTYDYKDFTKMIQYWDRDVIKIKTGVNAVLDIMKKASVEHSFVHGDFHGENNKKNTTYGVKLFDFDFSGHLNNVECYRGSRGWGFGIWNIEIKNPLHIELPRNQLPNGRGVFQNLIPEFKITDGYYDNKDKFSNIRLRELYIKISDKFLEINHPEKVLNYYRCFFLMFDWFRFLMHTFLAIESNVSSETITTFFNKLKRKSSNTLYKLNEDMIFDIMNTHAQTVFEAKNNTKDLNTFMGLIHNEFNLTNFKNYNFTTTGGFIKRSVGKPKHSTKTKKRNKL
jgi:hypothetical protein